LRQFTVSDAKTVKLELTRRPIASSLLCNANKSSGNSPALVTEGNTMTMSLSEHVATMTEYIKT
jgi:hypothetical protein